MERSLERDDTIALGMAIHRLVLARGLYRTFHRFGAGIAEKDIVRKTLLAQPVAERLLFRDTEQIGDVDRLVCLRSDCIRDPRMRMAERVDGYAGGEVEITLTIRGDEPGALSVVKRKIDTRESRKKMSGAHGRFLICGV